MAASPRSLTLLAATLLTGCPDDSTEGSATKSQITLSDPTSNGPPDTNAETTGTAAPTGTTDASTHPTTETRDTTDTTGTTGDDTGCTPESDAELCEAGDAECGALTREDACGEPRMVECGDCSKTLLCQGNRCEPISACVNPVLDECCTAQSGALSVCTLNACGVFTSAECIADDCAEELTEYSDCITFECPGLATCGKCPAFCDEVLTPGCAGSVSWSECIATCEAAGDDLQVGCGIGLSCQYNGACTDVPASICPQGSWRCREAAECIPKAALCDQHSDCVEASDEAQPGCESPQCAAGTRLCEGTCAACPAAAGANAFTCVADTCAVGSCAAGYLLCPAGCCKETTVVVDDHADAVRVLVGEDGAVHLTYYADDQTFYIRGTPDGKKWSGKVALYPKFTYAELAVDAAGKVYAQLSPDGVYFVLATNKSGAWVVKPMPNGVYFLDIEIGPDGRPHARSKAVNDVYSLWRREDDAIQWTNLGPIPGFGRCSNLASRPGGIEVVCADDTYEDLILYTYGAGKWSTKPVLAGVASIDAPRLAVDAQGELELAYEFNGLKLARSVKGVWSSENAPVPDGLGNKSPANLVVRDPARPYIRTFNDLFGMRTPGGWSFTAIDLTSPDIGVLVSDNPIVCGTTGDNKIVCRSAG